MADYKLPPWIPEEVSEALRAAQDANWNGHVAIHFHDGQPAEIHATRRIRVKRKGAEPSAPKCPECQREMESRDYGNLWLCSCGTKRTRAQMAQRGVAVGKS